MDGIRQQPVPNRLSGQLVPGVQQGRCQSGGTAAALGDHGDERSVALTAGDARTFHTR